MEHWLLSSTKTYDPQTEAAGTIEVPVPMSTNGHSDWFFPDDQSVDIAFTVLNGQYMSTLDTENAPISITELPNPEELKKVNSGAQIASAGLLLGASGSRRNYPIFKFGFVSSVPEEKISVACCPGCTANLQTEWMIAASLVPGNSGSPIFFVPVGFPGISVSGQRAFLLGVQSTSFSGYDVAGMAPVQFLLEAIRKVPLPDANFSIPGLPPAIPQGVPSAADPHSQKAIPGPIPIPKQ
jgi:hypothetical protein